MLVNIMAHNRSVCASPPNGGSGCVRLGHSASLHSHASLRHSFVALQTCGLLIRATKPSHTAGTLDQKCRIMYRIICIIRHRLFQKKCTLLIHKNIEKYAFCEDNRPGESAQITKVINRSVKSKKHYPIPTTRLS